MEGLLEYFPTGKYAHLRTHHNSRNEYQISDRWFVSIRERGANLEFGVVDMKDMTGAITPGNATWFSIPIGFRDMNTEFTVDGDTLIALVRGMNVSYSVLLVVYMDGGSRYKRREIHGGMSTPVGIAGDVVYLESGSAVIEGLNISTLEKEFEYTVYDTVVRAPLGKIYDGRKALIKGNFDIASSVTTSDVVTVPDGEVLLQIMDKVNMYRISGNGVFYNFAGDDHYYYSTFNGENYRVNIAHYRNIPVDGSYIEAVSNDGNSIWVRYLLRGGTTYLINYARREFNRQKSARS